MFVVLEKSGVGHTVDPRSLWAPLYWSFNALSTKIILLDFDGVMHAQVAADYPDDSGDITLPQGVVAHKQRSGR